MKYLVRLVLVVLAIAIVATTLKGMVSAMPKYDPVQQVDAVL